MELTFAVIGPGSVGSTLIRSLEQTGFQVAAVVGREDDLAGIPDAVSAIAICTPDDVIGEIAQALASTFESWDGRIVFHVSGALTSEVLAPLHRAGAATLSFHPLSTFPPDSRIRDFHGVTVAIEGSDQTEIKTMTEVADRLGANPVTITADQKAAYHLAASMASNFLVTLAGSVQEVLRAAELDIHLMDGLVADTLSNLRTRSAADALSGPIVRGDVETVRLHLATLQSLAPHLIAFYKSAARATVELAFAAGRLDEEQRSKLQAVVD